MDWSMILLDIQRPQKIWPINNGTLQITGERDPIGRHVIGHQRREWLPLFKDLAKNLLRGHMKYHHEIFDLLHIYYLIFKFIVCFQ